MKTLMPLLEKLLMPARRAAPYKKKWPKDYKKKRFQNHTQSNMQIKSSI